MVDEFGDNLIDQLNNVIDGLVLRYTILVLLTDLASETAEILVAPSNEVSLSAEKNVFQSVWLVIL
jgi:hypothetical protein